MKKEPRALDYKLSRFSSALFLVMIFVLIGAVVILATLYTSGVLNSGNSQVNTFSISNALCNSSGVYVSLKNNLNEMVSVASVQLLGLNRTISLSRNGLATSYNILGGAQVELSSGAFSCPVFNSLPEVEAQIVFNSSATAVYTFGNNYWARVLTNQYTNISETSH